MRNRKYIIGKITTQFIREEADMGRFAKELAIDEKAPSSNLNDMHVIFKEKI
jgi:hypothetical protein